MVVIRGRFYARPFDSDRSISPIYCTISRTKDLRVHLSPCTPAQSAPTVDSQRCLSNTDCRRNEFRTEKDILLGQNVTLLEKFRSNRCFDNRCFQTWLQTIRSAHFHGISGLVSRRYLPFQKRENLRCGRKDRKESSGRVQSMDGQRDPESIFDRFARKITSSRTESLQFRLTGSVS